MDCLASPAREHIVCMMMPRMIMMMVLMIMVMSMFLVVMAVMMFMALVVMVVMMFMALVVMIVMILMIMTTALTFFMMMPALRTDDLIEKFLLQRFTGLHRLKDLFTWELSDRSCNKRCLVIKLSKQGNALLDLLRLCFIGTA